MAWTNDWVLMLRHMINDVDVPQTYTDTRLQTALLVGAQFVVNEFTLQTTYTIDLAQLTINPDPTIVGSQLGTPDGWCTNLTVTKTALIMLRNNLRVANLSAWVIKDIDMSVDMRQVAVVAKQMVDDLEKVWDGMRSQYCQGVNPSAQAVLTPINIWAAGWRAPMLGYGERDRLVY